MQGGDYWLDSNLFTRAEGRVAQTERKQWEMRYSLPPEEGWLRIMKMLRSKLVKRSRGGQKHF